MAEQSMKSVKYRDYEVGYGKPPKHTQMKPGETLNPGGKPAKSRNRLQGAFLQALADDFEKHGKAAIAGMRVRSPADYIRVVASLMPKELEVGNTSVLDAMSEEELEEMLETLKRINAGDMTDVEVKPLRIAKAAMHS